MRMAFLGFVLDRQAHQLTHGAAAVRLSPKAFALLEHLIAERPRAISKRELMDLLWPETFVVEANLSNLIGELRAALDDDAKTPCAIRTVSRFGYAFCAQVTATAPAEPRPAVLWELTSSRGTIPLSDGPHLVGRGDDAEVRLDSPRVSRLHARIIVSGAGLTYEDLDSKNGTFDHGRPIQGIVPVDDGQTLVIGDVEVAFRRRRAESTATMAAASIKRPGAPAARSLKKP
jgi:DNA-binding winged helix-turn-helix (wHTH) protein